MKTRIASLFAFLSVLAVSNVSDAGTRNLTGSWTHGGDTWIIAHIGNQASFSTSDYNEETGLVSLNFDGFVSGSGDSFSYRGIGESINVRIDDVVCVLHPNMTASGYVAGKVGGRIIRMRSCTITIRARCRDEDTGRTMAKTFTEDCAGTWR